MDTEYLQNTTRAPKGNGRQAKITSIRIPTSVKRDIDSWKDAYEEKYGQKITYEQMFTWWMDNIGKTDNKWDSEIRELVKENTMTYINKLDTRKSLIDYLNIKGRFWEYNNHADETISDRLLISKGLLYLEFEDMPQLFALFGKQKCKRIFKEEIESKGKYYSNISFLLNTLFFS